MRIQHIFSRALILRSKSSNKTSSTIFGVMKQARKGMNPVPFTVCLGAAE